MQQYASHKKTVDLENIICFGVMVLVAALLFLRDVGGYSVNKYLFLILLAPPLLFLSEKNMYKLWAFIMPLYIGLPGNFITLVLFIRFFLLWLQNRAVQVTTIPFVLTIFICTFIVAQNFLLNYTTVYHMIYVVEYVVLYFIMTAKRKNSFSSVFLCYSCSIALVGIVMLANALRYVSFSDLTSVATRLGDVGITNEMTIVTDPNYYGLFALVSVAGNWCLLMRAKYNKWQAIIAVVVVFAAVCIGVIGLSRAFVICLAGWSVLVLLTEKKFTRKIALIGVLVLVLLLVFILIPDSVESIIDRLNDDDMKDGNGRLTLMQKWFADWIETPGSLLFGVGLFKCNAHCMQLQFLFGMGIVGFMLLASLMISYWGIQNKARKVRFTWSAMVPIIVLQVAAATVPIAQSMTFVMPIIMSILVYGEVTK